MKSKVCVFTGETERTRGCLFVCVHVQFLEIAAASANLLILGDGGLVYPIASGPITVRVKTEVCG